MTSAVGLKKETHQLPVPTPYPALPVAAFKQASQRDGISIGITEEALKMRLPQVKVGLVQPLISKLEASEAILGSHPHLLRKTRTQEEKMFMQKRDSYYLKKV